MRTVRTSRYLGAALVACALLGSACAMFDHDNRRTLNLLDESLTPTDSATRWAVAPIGLPVGVVALCADAAVVHPIASIDDAFDDTVDLLWTANDETAFRRAVMVPLAAIATPFVFAGDWVGRILFAIDPHDGGDDDEEAGP